MNSTTDPNPTFTEGFPNMTVNYDPLQNDETGGPAFPQSEHQFPGLTFREYLAALAMQACITSPDSSPVYVADQAWAFADAMLASLQR